MARPRRGCGITSTGGEGQIAACRPEGVWTPYPLNNGQTWVELPPTLDAQITVPGLPVGTTVLFRWRTLLDGVYGDWSPSLPYQVT